MVDASASKYSQHSSVNNNKLSSIQTMDLINCYNMMWICGCRKQNNRPTMGNPSYSHSVIPILMQFIPIPIPVPAAYSASFPFPWESHGTRGIPVVPIPMHISKPDLVYYYKAVIRQVCRGECLTAEHWNAVDAAQQRACRFSSAIAKIRTCRTVCAN